MKACFLFIIALLIFSPAVRAQKRFSKTYPANKSVRLQLANLSGTIEVYGWERNEIRVSAFMESPVAKMIPESTTDYLTINIVRDNQGRSDFGSINFKVFVPYNSSVDIETRLGNLTVRDVSGSIVRAKISLEGDINLSNVKADTVMAESMTGNLFFDGELRPGGTYSFKLTKGDINIRIPFTSSFKLAATAAEPRHIELGSFPTGGLSFVSDGRRVTGSVNDGRANMTILNKRGSIAFISR